MMGSRPGLVHAATLPNRIASRTLRVMPRSSAFPDRPGFSSLLGSCFSDGDRHDPGRKRRISLMMAGLLGANLLAWCWALLAFHGSPALLGSALIAWGFGLRHAVDADHIAAIDNVSRRLMQQGRRPIGIGLFFSLGHSTVVVLAGLVVVVAQDWFRRRLGLFAGWGAPVGATVSAAFLLLIGGSNFLVLLALLRLRGRLRRGEPAGNALPEPGGALSRLLAPLIRRVGTSRGMFWLGLLFGLGFDTATEVGVLSLAAVGAAHGQAGWAVMAFPALFTAGMALVDSADGVMMLGAYGWALSEPSRKLGYNMVITAGSVLVALLIGTAEVLDLIAVPGIATPSWARLLDTHSELVGYAVVGGFALLWSGSLLGWFLRRMRASTRST